MYRGIRIVTDKPHIRPVFEIVCKSPLLIRWLDNFQLDKFYLDSVDICDVDISTENDVRVITMNIDAYDNVSGKKIIDNTHIILREDTLGLLVIIEDEHLNKYVILNEKSSLATGRYSESILYENMNKHINVSKYRMLGTFMVSNDFTNEYVWLAEWIVKMTNQQIADIQINKIHTDFPYMTIDTRVYDYDDFEDELPRIADAKTTLAWLLHVKTA